MTDKERRRWDQFRPTSCAEFADRFDIRGRAIAEPAVQLGLVLELLAPAAGKLPRIGGVITAACSAGICIAALALPARAPLRLPARARQ